MHKIKVLLVDDDEINHNAIKTTFNKLGCNVELAEAGKKAIELFTKNRYQIIFMDIALLDMDGFTIAENLREIEKQKKENMRIPIVAISAYDDPSFKKHARTSGINDYLLKPMTFSQYRDTLIKFFPRHNLEQLSA